MRGEGVEWHQESQEDQPDAWILHAEEPCKRHQAKSGLPMIMDLHMAMEDPSSVGRRLSLFLL